MRKLSALLSLGILSLAAAAMPGCAQNKTAPAASTTADAGVVDLNNTKCPVTGDPVGSSKLTVLYMGKIYHFCCADCPKDFSKDPEKYAKLVAADPAKYGVK